MTQLVHRGNGNPATRSKVLDRSSKKASVMACLSLVGIDYDDGRGAAQTIRD